MEQFTGATTRNQLGLVDLLVETIVVSHLCGPNLKNECTFRSFSFLRPLAFPPASMTLEFF
jgi:hypothetical protein